MCNSRAGEGHVDVWGGSKNNNSRSLISVHVVLFVPCVLLAYESIH